MSHYDTSSSSSPTIPDGTAVTVRDINEITGERNLFKYDKIAGTCMYTCDVMFGRNEKQGGREKSETRCESRDELSNDLINEAACARSTCKMPRSPTIYEHRFRGKFRYISRDSFFPYQLIRLLLLMFPMVSFTVYCNSIIEF